MRTKSLLLSALVLLWSTLGAFSADLVRNGDFANGSDQWVWQLNGGGAGGQAVVDTDGGVLHVGSITDVGKQVYSIQMILSPITVAKGVRYHLKFDARSAAPRNLNVKVGGVEARGWADYTGNGGSGIAFGLTTATQTFEADVDMKEPTDKAARLEFSFGLNDADVWVDNVSFVPAGGDLVRDGTLQNGDLSKGTAYWDPLVLKAGWSGTGELVLKAEGGELSAQVLQVGAIAANPQIVQTGLVFEQGRQYQVSFYARSSREREIQVSLGADIAEPPFYTAYTPAKVFQLGAANQPYTFTFTMKESPSEDGKGKLAFALGTLNGRAVPATVTLSNIEVRELNTQKVSFTPVRADDLVRNGSFDLDAEGWDAAPGTTIAVERQELTLRAGAGAARVSQKLTVGEGETYQLSLTHRGGGTVALKGAAGDLVPLVRLEADPRGKARQVQVVIPAGSGGEADLVVTGLERQTLTVDRVSVRPAGPWMDAAKPVAERVSLLMDQMTVAEKAGQMVQAERAAVKTGDIGTWGIGSILSGGGSVPSSNTPDGWISMFNRFQAEALSSRLGIPLLYGIDAVHGHGNVFGATVFPHNIGLGATRDPALVEEIGRITAVEVAATGLNWTFGPAVSVARDDRWGRSYESFGESPELQHLLTPAFIRGLQGKKDQADWMNGPHIVGTAKHFMGDGGAEYGTGEGTYKIDRGDITTLSVPQLKALHGQGYIEAVRAGIGTVMASFNLFDGVHMHARKDLLTGWLKAPAAQGGLGFSGFVIGDWDAMGLMYEQGGDYAHKVLTSFGAGLDMSMEQSKWKDVIGILAAGVAEGTLDASRMDDAVRRILTVKFQAGVFDHPWALDTYADQLGSPTHRAVAAKAVQESAVLLKNDKAVLPLKAKAKVFVTGPLADNIGWQAGGWTIQWQGSGDQGSTRLIPGESILEGLQRVAKSLGGEIITDPARAKECSVAVVVVGEAPYAEGVGDVSTYSDMDLDTGSKSASGNLDAIDAARAAKLPVVVVLVSGRPLVVTKQLPQWTAFVAAWLPGSEGGALADVLYGKVPFQGKLPVTWPASVEQEPINVGDGDLAKKKPLFPYGYGLTYKK